MYKTMVFNGLYNWLILNYLHFGVKNPLFRVFFVYFNFTYLLHMEQHIFGNMENVSYIRILLTIKTTNYGKRPSCVIIHTRFLSRNYYNEL